MLTSDLHTSLPPCFLRPPLSVTHTQTHTGSTRRLSPAPDRRDRDRERGRGAGLMQPPFLLPKSLTVTLGSPLCPPPSSHPGPPQPHIHTSSLRQIHHLPRGPLPLTLIDGAPTRLVEWGVGRGWGGLGLGPWPEGLGPGLLRTVFSGAVTSLIVFLWSQMAER